MPGLPVSSIPQVKKNPQNGAYLELFQAIGCFEPSFIEAHQASKIIYNIRSVRSRIKTHSFLEEIITSIKEEFKDLESDMAVRIRTLVDPTRKPGQSDDTVMQNASS
jgi:hypothetical protein